MFWIWPFTKKQFIVELSIRRHCNYCLFLYRKQKLLKGDTILTLKSPTQFSNSRSRTMRSENQAPSPITDGYASLVHPSGTVSINRKPSSSSISLVIVNSPWNNQMLSFTVRVVRPLTGVTPMQCLLFSSRWAPALVWWVHVIQRLPRVWLSSTGIIPEKTGWCNIFYFSVLYNLIYMLFLKY